MKKKAQEEMVGFAVILVITAVIIVILIGFLIRTKNKVNLESYEIEGFLASALQYTSNCSGYLGFMDVKDLIASCSRLENCIEGQKSCEVLNQTLSGILSESWKTGDEAYIKGYYFEIFVDGKSSLVLKKGNLSALYTGGSQDFSKDNKKYDLVMNVHT